MDQLNQVIRILKTPVTLIVLLLVLVGGGYWGYKAFSTPIVTDQEKCVMTDVGSELTPNWVQVRVLNAGGKSQLAKSTANDILRPHGFTVIRINNSDRLVTKTVVIGNAVDDPEVRLVMQYFPDSVAEGDGRTDHVVDVLVGSAFVSPTGTPKGSVPVSGPVCLPQPLTSSTASATPTPTPTPGKKK